ncbi:MAG: STAS domain-containing protein [Calditrichia bacterium]
MEIKYKSEKRENILVFTITQNVVIHNHAASLKEKIFLEIADGNNAIVLDLSPVKEMDSSGLGALLFCKRQANNAGGNMVLVGVDPKVQTMIRIAQLTHVFEIFPSVEEACESFQD